MWQRNICRKIWYARYKVAFELDTIKWNASLALYQVDRLRQTAKLFESHFLYISDSNDSVYVYIIPTALCLLLMMDHFVENI